MYESSQRMHARYSLDSSWILRFSLATSIAVRDLFCCRALYLSLLLSCFLSSHTLQTHSFVRRTTSSKLVAHKPISRFIIIIVSHCIHAPSNKKFFSFHTEFWILSCGYLMTFANFTGIVQCESMCIYQNSGEYWTSIYRLLLACALLVPRHKVLTEATLSGCLS